LLGILGMGVLWEKLLPCTSPHDTHHEIWNYDEGNQVRVVTFMWEWWNSHNNVNAREGSLDPNVVCSCVERLLVDFMSFRKSSNCTKPPSLHRWTKPLDDYVKINFDGSFNIC
jgi:hypothetical protein